MNQGMVTAILVITAAVVALIATVVGGIVVITDAISFQTYLDALVEGLKGLGIAVGGLAIGQKLGGK